MQDFNRENKLNKFLTFIHEHIIVLIIVFVIMASIVSIFFIVNGDNDRAQNAKEEITYKPMDTLYFVMDKVETLNPLTSMDKDTYYISQLVYSSLFQLDASLNIEQDSVSKYSTNSSEGTVSITLKNDVKFSDGSKLTAEDVYFTVNQIFRIGNSSPYYEYVSKIKSVETTGTYTLNIIFEDPSDAALDNLVFPIVSSGAYFDDENKPIGSGKYMFGSYDKTKYLNLKPNPKCTDSVGSNKIQFKIVPDKSKTTGLMTTDSITAYVNTSSDADVDAEDKNLKSTEIPSSEAELLAFNFKNKDLANVKVRQAIAKAIDVETVIEDNYGTSAVASDTVYFPGFLGIGKKSDAYAYDQKGAADLLASAGYQDYDEDGILEDKNKKAVKFTLIVNSNGENRLGTALTIADALELVGIKVDIKKMSWEQYQRTIKNGDFDMYLGGYRFDKQYNLKELFDFKNDLGYNNKAVVSQVNKLETALTAQEQKNVFSSLHKQLVTEIPYYSLCYKTYSFVTVDRFEGEEFPTFFDVYRGANTWNWQQTVTVEKEE